MEGEDGDAVSDDTTAVPSERPVTDVDLSSPSPEQEHRLEFFDQRFEASPVLDSQGEEREGESDSHSRTYATASPSDSPGIGHSTIIHDCISTQRRQGMKSCRSKIVWFQACTYLPSVVPRWHGNEVVLNHSDNCKD